jgi:N-acetylmuramoyl-L-alanine amidase
MVRAKTINKTKYVLLRDIARTFSAGLSWFRVSSKTVMTLNNHRIGFFYGTRKVTLDSKRIFLKDPSVLSGGKVYIPLDFLLNRKFQDVSRLNIDYYKTTRILTLQSAPNVRHPRIYTGGNFTKVIFELAEPLKYKIQRENSRIYSLNFYKGWADKDKIDFNDKFLKSVELKNRNRIAACKIKLNSSGLILSDKYEPSQKRLTINITPEDSKKYRKTDTHAVKRIVIDPGHGGEDPGAIGPNGTEEKKINLNIAKESAKLLEADGYEVFLTREDDVFMPLVERTQFANNKKADIFISIHCNASPKKSSAGYEIYFLSEKASDPDAEATAAFENSAINLEKEMSPKQTRLQELLWSMVVNEFINESSELCSFITEETIRRSKIANRGIRQGGFYVLRGAQMPAILIECAFLTNAQEEVRLRSTKFQKQVCDAIYSGIREYDYRKTLIVKGVKGKGT